MLISYRTGLYHPSGHGKLYEYGLNYILGIVEYRARQELTNLQRKPWNF